MPRFTIDNLITVMRECAGEEESINLTGDIDHVRFDALGYDSLALLETVAHISREYGIPLPDDMVGSISTPAEFIEIVNRKLEEATRT